MIKKISPGGSLSFLNLIKEIIMNNELNIAIGQNMMKKYVVYYEDYADKEKKRLRRRKPIILRGDLRNGDLTKKRIKEKKKKMGPS